MISGILGTKIGMTHLFTEEGKMVPVTVIQAGPVFVTQVKTEATDGYNAVQVGFGEVKDKHLTFPKYGHLKKAGVNRNLRTLKEFRVEQTDGIELGQEFNVDLFSEGDVITVTGMRKGRGFAGGVKRYHF
jgi:large subunit ribosomal protein L3